MPTHIVCFGDSITQGSGFCEGGKWPTILHFKLDVWRPGAFKVFNRGIGGNTTPEALRRIKDDVLPLMPGVVLAEFGINDRGLKDWIRDYWVSMDEYKRNLALIHAIAARHGGRCVFLVNHPIGCEIPWPLADDLSCGAEGEPPYDQAIREVAAACGAPLIDLPRLLRERKIMARQLLSPDRCHLSAEGNRHYAEAVFSGLQVLL